MSTIITFKIQAEHGSFTIAGEQLFIPGENDVFALHRSTSWRATGEDWTVTHVESGFAVAFGKTRISAIQAAKLKWNAVPKDRRDAALANALKIKADREVV